MLQNGGFIPKSGIGLNETALFGLFKQEMTLPGGERSAFKLTKQLMECSHRRMVFLLLRTFQIFILIFFRPHKIPDEI